MKQELTQWKVDKVDKIANDIKEYPIVGILNLKSLPAAPLQKIKNDLKSIATIKVMKKCVLERALEKAGKKELVEYLDVQPALLLTKESPFKIYNKIVRNKTDMPAKPGQTAQKDIEVKAGPTDLMPGPAITALSSVGIPAKVEQGKIAVMKDKVVCKAGEPVSAPLASALTMLGMKPMKIGLDVHVILENGVIYQKDVLFIDDVKTMTDITTAFRAALELTLSAGIVTVDNVETMIQKSFREAKTLCLEAGVMSKEIIGDILSKAVREASALEDKVGPIEVPAEKPKEEVAEEKPAETEEKKEGEVSE